MTCCGPRRDIFLKIERVVAYSPLAPEPCSRRCGRDAMFNQGHELGRVQPGEIIAARFTRSLTATPAGTACRSPTSEKRRRKRIQASLQTSTTSGTQTPLLLS